MFVHRNKYVALLMGSDVRVMVLHGSQEQLDFNLRNVVHVVQVYACNLMVVVCSGLQGLPER